LREAFMPWFRLVAQDLDARLAGELAITAAVSSLEPSSTTRHSQVAQHLPDHGS